MEEGAAYARLWTAPHEYAGAELVEDPRAVRPRVAGVAAEPSRAASPRGVEHVAAQLQDVALRGPDHRVWAAAGAVPEAPDHHVPEGAAGASGPGPEAGFHEAL